MNNIINFFKRTLRRYIDSFKRFYVGQGLIVGLGLFLCIGIIAEFDESIGTSVSLAFCISLLISFLIRFNSDNKILYISIPLVLVAVLSFVFIKHYENVYVMVACAGACATILCLLYYWMLKNTKGNLLIYLLSKNLYISVLCSILLIGLFICTFGFQLLIYEFNHVGKIVAIIFIIIEMVLSSTLFVSYLPYKDEELTYNNVFTSLLSKIPLTLYYLLLVILYIYLIKIVITWTLPVGVINWFASFALYFYIYFVYASSDDYFLSKFHQKYGSYVLIPIFIIQQISIFIRVNAYGLTELRVLSLAFNLIALILIVLNIFKKRNLFFIISACIIFIVTVVPYTNIIDLPVLEQEARLKRVLKDNNMYEDGEIVPNSSINNETKGEIISCFDFLSDSISNRKSLLRNDSDFKKLFGFDRKDYVFRNEDDSEFCSYYSNIDSIDLQAYKTMEFIKYEEIEDDEELIRYCESLYDKYGSHVDDGDLVFKYSDNRLLYIEYLSFKKDGKGSISSITVNGYMLNN